MKVFHWWPNRRGTYRIIKVRHWLDDYALEQRYRWLWFEWWRKIDGGCDITLGLLKRKKAHLESLDIAQESERVVDVTR